MYRALFLLVSALALSPGVLAAQVRTCDFTNRGTTSRDQSTGLVTLSDPFEVQCTDGVILRASSGTLNQVSRELTLVGNVYFEDPSRTLTSQNATYSSAIGRLYATGDVVFTDRVEGTVLRGPELEYFRAMEGRPEPQVNAGQRPHLTLRQKPGEGESAEEAPEPLEIDADRMTIVGQDDLTAIGNVVIQRTGMRAVASEARYQGEQESLELRRDAQIHSEDHSLSGDVIEARLSAGDLEHVRARGKAVMTGDDLQVTAPQLDLFFEADLLQRTVAVSPPGEAVAPRALAESRTFRLAADSIDALLPGQRLQQVVAIGTACGETMDTTRADTVRACAATADSAAAPRGPQELIANDWMIGDTITGYFAVDSAKLAEAAEAEGDTAVVLERLVARGSAQSLYRVTPQEASRRAAGRSLSFLSADVIDLEFAAGEVHVAEVAGLRRGVYLEPTARAAAPSAPPADPGGAGPGGVTPEGNR